MSNKNNQIPKSKVCSKCFADKKTSEYYMTANTLINADRRLSICKKCFWDLVDFDNKSSLIEVLRAIDRPYLHEMYLTAKKSERKNLTGEYMRLIGMKQNIDKTYEDSDFGEDSEEFVKKASEYNYDEVGFTEEEMEQLIQFWGRGYTLEEYEFLQTEYETFLNSYEADSYSMVVLLQEAAQQRLVIKQNREKGKAVDKDLKTLQEIFTAAGIKPVQETEGNSTDQATFGTLIKKFEDEKPIPEPDPEWKDVNKIQKYINVFFKGHLGRMLGLENDTQKEYNKEIEKYTVKPPNYDGDDKDE